MQPGVDQRRADRIWWANIVGGVALSILCSGAGLAFLLGAIQLEGEEDSSAGLGLLLLVIGVVFVFVTVRVARARRNTTAEERRQMAQGWVAAGEMEDLPTPEHRAAMRQLKERAGGASGVSEKDVLDLEIADAWRAILPEGWRSAELFWAEIGNDSFVRAAAIDATGATVFGSPTPRLTAALRALRELSSVPDRGRFIGVELRLDPHRGLTYQLNWDRRFWFTRDGASFEPVAEGGAFHPDERAWAEELGRQQRAPGHIPGWWLELSGRGSRPAQ